MLGFLLLGGGRPMFTTPARCMVAITSTTKP